MNAYISLPVLQKALNQLGKVNALFTDDTTPFSPDLLQFTLDDLGLYISEYENYFALHSNQFLIKPVLSGAALSVALENDIPALPTLTYLANSITFNKPSDDQTLSHRIVPYSTILSLPVEDGEFAELMRRNTTDSENKVYNQEKKLEMILQASESLLQIENIGVRADKLKKEINELRASYRMFGITSKNEKRFEEVMKSFADIKNETISASNQIYILDIYLNAWTADDLGVMVGDKIDVTYYSVNVNEEYFTETQQFLLKGIVPIEGIAADRNIIPDFPGVSESSDISDWEPPFPFDNSMIRTKDEEYWDEFKSTAKAFIPLDSGKKLWENRFGDLTTIRMTSVPSLDVNETKTLFESEFVKKVHPEHLGFQFIPLRSEGLQSAKGSSDFGMLFSSMSVFIIIAVALLVGMVFRIGVEQRSREIGILQAVGYPLAKIRGSFLLEGGVISFIGCIFGCFLAIGYARLMIYGLQTWWLPAIGTPFLKIHIGAWSLLIGALISLAVIVFSIYRTVGKLGKNSTVSLLAGETDFVVSSIKRKEKKRNRVHRKSLIIAVIVIGLFFGTFERGKIFTGDWSGIWVTFVITIVFLLTFRWFYKKNYDQSSELKTRNIMSFSLFFSVSVFIGILLTLFPFVRNSMETVFGYFEHPVVRFLLLTTVVLFLGWTFFGMWLNSQKESNRLNRMQFALKNAARQPSRSKTCVATISLACCIIVAVGGNKNEELAVSDYAFVAESSLPIHHNLNTSEGRFELGFDDEDSTLISKSTIFPFRVLPGEDVSCLNLYKPGKPQVLGATDSMLNDSNWKNLIELKTVVNIIPAIGDENSLRWILHHNPDDYFEIQDEFGETLHLKLETIQNSLFQSQLIISESDFTKHFPSQSGYQFFLIKTPSELWEKTSNILENTLQDYGFDVTSASQRLASFRSVQNTYISTFQSLGGLGILLGTFGLALVLVRNIMERKGELATLRAFGFRRILLSRILFLESSFLLFVGMLIGVIAGLAGVIDLQDTFLSFPWFSLTITLLFILGFGIIANATAVFFALRMPLLSTLKME